jgi:hypothetical protein
MLHDLLRIRPKETVNTRESETGVFQLTPRTSLSGVLSTSSDPFSAHTNLQALRKAFRRATY